MPSAVYSKLIADSPDFSLCRYGRNSALGMRGTKGQIDLATNLFANYDRPVIARPLSHDLSYITTSPRRVRAAIKLYLHVNLLHSREVPSYSTWDEETGVYTLESDDAKAEAIAAQDADAFMSHIRLRFPFIPSETVTRRRADINA